MPRFTPPPPQYIQLCIYCIINYYYYLIVVFTYMPIDRNLNLMFLYFALANGGIVEATQEMLALGMCNIAGSFIMSMPTCGAFTRSALSQASGVQTTLSNIYASGLILLAILFLTPHFHLIPRAILSSILISAVLFMVDYQIVKPLWKTNREFIICVPKI